MYLPSKIGASNVFIGNYIISIGWLINLLTIANKLWHTFWKLYFISYKLLKIINVNLIHNITDPTLCCDDVGSVIAVSKGWWSFRYVRRFQRFSNVWFKANLRFSFKVNRCSRNCISDFLSVNQPVYKFWYRSWREYDTASEQSDSGATADCASDRRTDATNRRRASPAYRQRTKITAG